MLLKGEQSELDWIHFWKRCNRERFVLSKVTQSKLSFPRISLVSFFSTKYFYDRYRSYPKNWASIRQAISLADRAFRRETQSNSLSQMWYAWTIGVTKCRIQKFAGRLLSRVILDNTHTAPTSSNGKLELTPHHPEDTELYEACLLVEGLVTGSLMAEKGHDKPFPATPSFKTHFHITSVVIIKMLTKALKKPMLEKYRCLHQWRRKSKSSKGYNNSARTILF